MAFKSLARAYLGLAWASMGQAQASGGTDGQTDEWMDEGTNGWNFSPFYRTSSPIRAAAQERNMREKEKKGKSQRKKDRTKGRKKESKQAEKDKESKSER